MIDLKPACERMSELVAAVEDRWLDAPTPCADHTVRHLIEHVDQVARGADEPVALEPGWRDAVPDRVRTLGAVWDDPAAWEGVGPLGLPNDRWGRIVLTELVVHGWDLARATGRPFAADEPSLRACLDHVAEFVPQAPVPELWGPAVQVPDGAPTIDRIVAVTGRTP